MYDRELLRIKLKLGYINPKIVDQHKLKLLSRELSEAKLQREQKTLLVKLQESDFFVKEANKT